MNPGWRRRQKKKKQRGKIGFECVRVCVCVSGMNGSRIIICGGTKIGDKNGTSDDTHTDTKKNRERKKK